MMALSTTYPLWVSQLSLYSPSVPLSPLLLPLPLLLQAVVAMILLLYYQVEKDDEQLYVLSYVPMVVVVDTEVVHVSGFEKLSEDFAAVSAS